MTKPFIHEDFMLNSEAAKVLYHDLFTNGIVYLDLGFDLHTVPKELIPLTEIFGRALFEMGTETEDYVKFSQRIGKSTGGVYADAVSTAAFGSGHRNVHRTVSVKSVRWSAVRRMRGLPRSKLVDARQVVPDARVGYYVATGHLVYVREDRTVLAVPFNPKALRTEGTPVAVLDSVYFSSGVFPYLSLSSSGTLVMRTGDLAEAQQFELVVFRARLLVGLGRVIVDGCVEIVGTADPVRHGSPSPVRRGVALLVAARPAASGRIWRGFASRANARRRLAARTSPRSPASSRSAS